MKQMKYTAWMLSGFLALAGLTGCGTGDSGESAKTAEEGSEKTDKAAFGQGQGMEKQLTAEELEAYEKAKEIEIKELELQTDWKEKAEITLGESVTVNGTGAEVTEDHVILITEGGSYKFTGTLKDGMISVKTEDAVKLVLNGVSISNGNGPAIYAVESSSCYIETVKGTENDLTDASQYAGNATEDTGEESSQTEEAKAAVFSNDELVLLGEGILKVTGNYKHAVSSDDHVFVEGGTYELTAEKDGIHANDWVCVEEGTLQITAADDGIQSEGPWKQTGGSISIAADGKGITAYGDVYMEGGTLVITQCTEGLESKNDMNIIGGTIEITGSDDGLNARSSITVDGGTVYADSSAGDALDSNGTLTINGGLVLAFGAQAPEGGVDCDQNEFVVNGGTLIATGGTNSTPSDSASGQVSALLGSAEKGETVGVLDGDGKTVFAFEAPKAYANLLLSVKTLTRDTDYSVYTGGTISGSSIHGYYADGTYEGGTKSISFTTDSMVTEAGGTSDPMGGGKGGPGGGRSGTDGSGERTEGGEPPELPDGELPEDGQRPGNGQFPSDGSMPEGGMPKDGQSGSGSADAV